MSRRATSLAALALVALTASCGGEDRTPEGAVRRFIRAVDEGNAGDVYRLLTPAVQQELQEKAQRANAQTGGGQRFKPEDMLAVGQVAPKQEPSTIKTLAVQQDRARVEVGNPKKQLRETLQLERVNGVWRVVLPPERPEERAPATKTATPGASRPAAATRPAAFRPTPTEKPAAAEQK